MSTNQQQYITNWSLYLNPVESSMEVLNVDPGFEEFGRITFGCRQRHIIAERSMDEEEEDTLVICDSHETSKSDSLDIKLSFLCSGDQVTDYWVEAILESLEVDPLLIDYIKPQIVSKAVQMAIETKNRGLKQFVLMAEIEIELTTEVDPEIDLMEQEEELRLILMQSMTMREMTLRPNPASKSSIEKLKRGFFEVGDGDDELEKNCGVCLDDFENGSEIVWMPCSHMFHWGGCLDRWFKERNSCPLCRLELTD